MTRRATSTPHHRRGPTGRNTTTVDPHHRGTTNRRYAPVAAPPTADPHHRGTTNRRSAPSRHHQPSIRTIAAPPTVDPHHRDTTNRRSAPVGSTMRASWIVMSQTHDAHAGRWRVVIQRTSRFITACWTLARRDPTRVAIYHDAPISGLRDDAVNRIVR
jgi:hypothetical protein